jgi:cytochrome c oxidase subunit 2
VAEGVHSSPIHQEAFLIQIVVILVLTLSATASGSRTRPANSGIQEIETIDVTASQFQFEPGIITVVEGDRVRLRLRSADRTHGIGIKAFRVKTLIPKTGEIVTVEFVADRVGTFDIVCSEYCGAGHSAMKGRLIVLARGK